VGQNVYLTPSRRECNPNHRQKDRTPDRYLDTALHLALSLGPISVFRFRPKNGAPIRDYRKSWEKACIAAGIPGRIVQDFRRTAVRNMERAGVSRSVAMKLTGHLSEAVYRRYAIVCESDLAEPVNKLQTMFNLPHHSKQPVGIVSGIDAHKRVQTQSSNKDIRVAGNA
jgi:integrase